MDKKYTEVTVDYVEKEAFKAELIWLVIALVGFAGITYLVVSGTTQNVDLGWTKALYQSRTGWMTTLMELFTYLGTWQAIVVVCLLLMMYKNTMLSFGIPMGIAGLLEVVLNHLVKTAVARPRPDVMYRALDIGGYSYPSGHACAAIAVYFLMALLVIKYVPKYRGSPRKPVSMLLITLAIGIGISRAYLGVHYVSDVIGGQLLGLAIAMAVMMFWGWLARKKNIEVARRVSPTENVDFKKVQSGHLKDGPTHKKHRFLEPKK